MQMKAYTLTTGLCAILSTCLPSITSAQQPLAPAQSSTNTDAIKRDDLRYDGKSFAEWRRYLRTELKLERRKEGLKALVEFAHNGYTTEATKYFVETFGKYPWRKITQGKIELTTDEENYLVAVNKSLRKLNRKAMEKQIAQALNHANENVRYFAAYYILTWAEGSQWQIPSQHRNAFVYTTPEPLVMRSQMLETIVSAQLSKEAIIVLGICAADGRHQKQFAAIFADAQHAQRATQRALTMLQSTINVERYAASALLGEIGPPARAAIPALKSLVADSDWNVRTQVIDSLEEIGGHGKNEIPKLIRSIDNAKLADRPRLLWNLHQTQHVARLLLPYLIRNYNTNKHHLRSRRFDNPHIDMVIACIDLWEKMGPSAKAAMPVLYDIMQNGQHLGRNATMNAAQAIERISGQRSKVYTFPVPGPFPGR